MMRGRALSARAGAEAIPGVRGGYDANGNVTNDGTRAFT
jgi:hypothetical protein